MVTLGSNYTIINTTLTNVTLYGTGTLVNSTITDTTLNDTNVTRSNIDGMFSVNTTVTDTSIRNPTYRLNDSVINVANVTGGYLYSGAITYNGQIYYATKTLSSIYAPIGPTVRGIECANETRTGSLDPHIC